jgi:hypothetical protein
MNSDEEDDGDDAAAVLETVVCGTGVGEIKNI